MKMAYFIPCIQTIIIEGTTKLFLNHVFQYREHHKEQPHFKVNNQIWIQQQNVKTTWPLDKIGLFIKSWSIHHHEKNQCCGFLTRASIFYENSSCGSYYFIGALPCIHHPRKSWIEPPLLIEVNGEQEYKRLFDLNISNSQI